MMSIEKITNILVCDSLCENFKTAAGQLSDRLKIFAGQKKNLSDRKNDQKKKPEDQWSCKRSPET